MKIPITADAEIKVGTLLEIPKGTEWKSTHPSKDYVVTKFTKRIRVKTVIQTWDDRITWAGGGNYWKWVKKTDAKIVSE